MTHEFDERCKDIARKMCEILLVESNTEKNDDEVKGKVAIHSMIRLLKGFIQGYVDQAVYEGLDGQEVHKWLKEIFIKNII